MQRYRKAFWLSLLGAAGGALLLALVPSSGEGQAGRKVTILSTASGNGEVVPCG